jgi:SAM-dependent methyltransferase
MDERLKAAIAELGAGEYSPGSSATAGWVYNPLPFPGCEGLKVHRPDSVKRWEIIAQHTDFQGKTVLDAGCATGYFSFKAAQNEASNVLGMDADPKAIAVCQAAAEAFSVQNVTFECSAIHVLDRQFDVVFALSILNWMGKANAGLWLAWCRGNIGMLWAEIPVRGDGRGGAAWLRDEVDVKRWLLRYFRSVEVMGETQGPHRGKLRTLYKCS